MKEWKLFFTDDVEDDIEALGKTVRLRIFEKLDWLQYNFEMVTPLLLSNI